MQNIENLHPNVILNSLNGRGDARIIQSKNIDKIVSIIFNKQLNFKELDLLPPQVDGNTNEFNLTSPSTYMNSLLRFIYMYEHNLLEIRCDQLTYTYDQMMHKAKLKYQKCKLAEEVMIANEWRALHPAYIKAVKCYKGISKPSKEDLADFKALYEEHKNDALCSIHIEMLKAVIDKFSFDILAAKNQLANLQALKEMNELAGFPNPFLDREIETLQTKIQAA